MKRIYVIPIMILAIHFMACNKHQGGETMEAIELNNGEKWKVHDNMMIHIRNMEKDVLEFEKAEEKDYQSLAEKLKPNIDLLTADCTMKGKAHDELHKWLLPYIGLVNELSETKNETSKVYQNIQEAFKTFNQYFE